MLTHLFSAYILSYRAFPSPSIFSFDFSSTTRTTEVSLDQLLRSRNAKASNSKTPCSQIIMKAMGIWHACNILSVSFKRCSVTPLVLRVMLTTAPLTSQYSSHDKFRHRTWQAVCRRRCAIHQSTWESVVTSRVGFPYAM